MQPHTHNTHRHTQHTHSAQMYVNLRFGCRGVGTSEIDLSSPLNYGTPSSRLGIGTPRTPGAAGTPIRPRSDVRSERKMRTVNVGSDNMQV